MAVATPLMPDHVPIAWARSSGRNEACRMARLSGVSSAAPTPCSARARMSTVALGAMPHTSEAAANHSTPTMKLRRRP